MIVVVTGRLSTLFDRDHDPRLTSEFVPYILITMFSAAIFDLDGLLINSEPLWVIAKTRGLRAGHFGVGI